MRYLLTVIFVFVCTICNSQEILVKGAVIDESELPFAGAQIINLNTKAKALSNFDGIYNISAKIGDTIKFKAWKKIEECYTTSIRIVFSSSNIDVKLISLDRVEDIYCSTKPKELLVFVGKLNFVESVFKNDICSSSMNSHGIGHYEVLQEVYDDFLTEKKIIRFDISEHANSNSFIYNKYKYALLFVVKYCDNKYYLLTYRHIYRTKNKKWALRYNKWNYRNIDSIEYKMDDIEFKKASIKVKKNEVNDAVKHLELPFYKRKGRRFIPLKGNYVEDYFKLWKGTLNEWKYDNE